MAAPLPFIMDDSDDGAGAVLGGSGVTLEPRFLEEVLDNREFKNLPEAVGLPGAVLGFSTDTLRKRDVATDTPGAVTLRCSSFPCCSLAGSALFGKRMLPRALESMFVRDLLDLHNHWKH
jgi:hypothetical protein